VSARRTAVVVTVVVLVGVGVVVARGGERDQPATVQQTAAALPARPAQAPTTRPSPARPATASPTGDATVSPEHDPDHDELDEAVPSPTPAPAVWDDAAATAATAVAAESLSAFARPAPGADVDAWWARFAKTLSTAAAPVYGRVDPRLVPYTQVLKVGPAQQAGSDLLASVTSTTDAGVYEVLLSRQDGASGWLVERLRPQEQP